MSSQVLTNAGQTAFQRWELRDLDTAGRAGRGTQRLPTAADVEQVHHAAHAEGYAAGQAEGLAATAVQSTRLRTFIASLAREVRACETQVAEDVLSLALELARRMTREALAVRRDLILPVVREAMHEMPLYGAPARLLVHPLDADTVRAHLGEQLQQLGWRLVEDDQIAPGGCRIESAATNVDATLATRWERLAGALGRDTAWLEAGPRPDGVPATDPAA